MKKDLKHVNFTHPASFTRAKYLSYILAPHVSTSKKLLDVGCGNMLIAHLLKERCGISTQGVDVVDINLTNQPHTLFDGKKLPFKKNEFDVSMIISVLHHIENQEELLQEVIRATKKRIIIFEDIYYTKLGEWWIKFLDIIGNLKEKEKTNMALTFREVNDWKKFFQKHGLNLSYEKTIWLPFRLSHHALFVLDIKR